MVGREDTGQEWKSIWLSKHKNERKFSFNDDRICGGEFSSADVEIIELFNRAVRFSVIVSTSGQLLLINGVFSENSSVQQFFREIRSQQNRVIIFPRYLIPTHIFENKSLESNRCKV